MLDPAKTYSFLWDKATNRPACVIIQALYGGSREACQAFQHWQVEHVDTFVRITATGAEIEKYATALRQEKT